MVAFSSFKPGMKVLIFYQPAAYQPAARAANGPLSFFPFFDTQIPVE